MKIKVYTAFVIVLLSSCLNNQIAQKTNIQNVSFGSGGGFTGEVVAYSLAPDGQINKIGKGEIQKIKKIDKKETKKIFERVAQLKTFKFYEPGNIYSFIEIKEKDSINRIVWSFGSTQIDNQITQLHRDLVSLTK